MNFKEILSDGEYENPSLEAELAQLSDEELDQRLASDDRALEIADAHDQVEMIDRSQVALTAMESRLVVMRNKITQWRRVPESTQRYISMCVNHYRDLIDAPSLSVESNMGNGLDEAIKSIRSNKRVLMDKQHQAIQRLSAALRGTSVNRVAFSMEDFSDTEHEEIHSEIANAETLAGLQSGNEVRKNLTVLQAEMDAQEEASVVVDALEQEQEENGSVSAESLILAKESLRYFYGMTGNTHVTALESRFTPGKRYHVDIEKVRQSMESRIHPEKVKNWWDALKSSLVRRFSFVGTRTMLHRVRLNRLIDKADSAQSKGGHEVVIDMKYLHRDGRVPSNLASYLQEYLKWFSFYAGDYAFRASRILNNNGYAAVSSNTLNDLKSKWKDVIDSRTDPQFPVPGGRRLFADRKPRLFSNTPGADFFMKQAYSNYPTVILARRTGDNLRHVRIRALSSTEIEVTSKAFLKILKEHRFVNGFFSAGQVDTVVLEVLDRVIRMIVGYDDFPGEKVVDKKIIHAALWRQFQSMMHVTYDGTATLLTVSSGWIKAAHRMLP